MKIALLVNYFPPEIGSAADLFYQLALSLKAKGHSVTVYTSQARSYNLASNKLIDDQTFGKKLWKIEDVDGLNVYRLKLLPIIYPRSAKNTFFKEMEHLFQPFMFTLVAKQLNTADVILIYSPPLVLGYWGSIIGKLINTPIVLNVQDIHPAAIIDLELLTNKIEILFLESIERQMYRLSSAISVHSIGNKKVIMTHGAKSGKISVIYNTCKIPNIDLLNQGKQYREKNFPNAAFIVTYAGIMSYSQDLDTIVNAAKILSDKKEDITFVMAGDGAQRPYLESKCRELGINNIIFKPFQQGDDYWQLLSGSDACFVSLKASKVKTPVVPRKLQDIMAAGRPIIANIPLGGDVQEIIQTVNCGIAIEAENPDLLAITILKMRHLPESERSKYGSNGRQFAVHAFSSSIIAKQYEELFKLVTNAEDQ